ncbi:MAG: adenosylcobinamide amidohydrolase [Spirochaetes bacterium]|nr:adenosylcobinamide amidohydrolase [Spirochaetota bacterium]
MNRKIFNKILITAIAVFLTLNFQSVNIFISSVSAAECECNNESGSTASEYKNNILYDIYGKPVNFKRIPAVAISLVPAVTEIIEAVKPEYRLRGVTVYDSNMYVAEKAEILGGFRIPDTDKLKSLKPDVVIAASIHKNVHELYKDSGTHVIILEANNPESIYKNIEIIGRLLHKENNAEKIISEMKAKIAGTQKKASAVPQSKRLRVIRLMGFDGKKLLVPGDDSFQIETVRLAGGIPIKTGRKGQSVQLSLEEWKKFDPQFVYSCGDSAKMWSDLSSLKGWKDVSAVKNRQHRSFNCNHTCRPSVNYAAFAEYLSACLYGDIYFSGAPLKKDGSTRKKQIKLDIPYVSNASVKYGTVDDFEHKTLVIKLKKKFDVLSTLTGLKQADTIGNHFLSPPRWNDGHNITLESLEKKICNAVNAEPDSSSFLMTGADLDNLAVVSREYKDFKVYALVTAGVMGNAQRQSRDEGQYYPHGTVNMIILSNTGLSGGAMARAIVTATEAKTAALQDMDIRSSYTPLDNQATGTGTDNIIVVSGEGMFVDSTGGHTKMGELIGKAVYTAVIEAVGMQNKVKPSRSVFDRLRERKITIQKLAAYAGEKIPANKRNELTACMEIAIQDKEIAGFLEAALAMSDAWKKNQIRNVSCFNEWSLSIAEKIYGKKIIRLIRVNIDNDKNSPLNTALSGLLTGAVYRVKTGY